MADIFVSYARPDEAQAKRVADALRDAGFSVWRDDELPAHRAYADVIQERLTSSKAVVVLWSADAAKSQWVRAEADVGRNAGTLVQVSLDDTIPPLPFNQIQCATLGDLEGESTNGGWPKLLASVRELVGEPINFPGPAPPPRKHGICVLPFANMSGDAEQEYFSDGISEDITTDLSKVSALAVTARNTAFMFKGQGVDVCNLADRLGVSHVLEGSVRKAGGRVRITAQLIDGSTGDHVWAERYDRDLTDIFAIQDEISRAIVDALKVRLLPAESRAIAVRGTENVEAYNLYLMARQYWITGNHGDRRREQRVIRICQRALEIDPNYAQAWALLAIAQSNLRYGLSDASSDEGVDAAKRALELDPTIAEAHCAIARQHSEMGRLDDAEAELKAGLKLDPDSWEVNKEAARFYFHNRRLEEAQRHFEKATEVMETDFHAWGLLYSCYHAAGNTAGSRRAAQMLVKQVERALVEDPSNGSALSLGATGFAVLGESERAHQWIERALLIDPDNLNMRYNFACCLASSIGEPEAAIDMLEPVFARTGQSMVKLAGRDPDLDSLREDERFQRMMANARKRVGIDSDAASPAAS